MNTTKRIKAMAGAWVVSICCLQAQAPQVENIGSKISRENAQSWIENFKAKNKDEARGHFYGSRVITELLKTSGCAGVYIFNGMDGDGKTHLVFKAVNENGEMLASVNPVDQGQLCPPNCPEPPPGGVASIGDRIPEVQAQQWIANFQNANKNRLFAQLYGKKILEELLSQPGVEGLYFGNALDQKGNERLVVVGVKSDGTVLWDGPIVDQGQLCPPNCPGYPPQLIAEKESN
jgi:hypothetical protein